MHIKGRSPLKAHCTRTVACLFKSTISSSHGQRMTEKWALLFKVITSADPAAGCGVIFPGECGARAWLGSSSAVGSARADSPRESGPEENKWIPRGPCIISGSVLESRNMMAHLWEKSQLWGFFLGHLRSLIFITGGERNICHFALLTKNQNFQVQ